MMHRGLVVFAPDGPAGLMTLGTVPEAGWPVPQHCCFVRDGRVAPDSVCGILHRGLAASAERVVSRCIIGRSRALRPGPSRS
jgi:hypothetical protein